MTCPFENPLTVNPAPETPTVDIVTFAPPLFVMVVLCVLLLPTSTLLNVKLELFALSCPGAVTVRLIVLLVTLPTEFVTVTLNCDPLSELIVAGVV